MEDKTLRNAFHNWEKLSMTPEHFLAYETRFKHIMDEEAFKREMELIQEEAKQVKQKAEQKAQEAENETKKLVAQRLLTEGFEIDYVIK